MNPSAQGHPATGPQEAPAIPDVGTGLRRHAATASLLLAILVSLYLLWPALHAVHLEGFTAQTQSLAYLMSSAPGLEHDPYLPRVSQFIYQTRSGVVDILALVYRVFPAAGDSAYHGLVLASFGCLVVSSLVFARRWGAAPLAFGAFALVLTPGIPEAAFFFNDNIVSAAFAIAALACVPRDHSVRHWLAAGGLAGLAVVCRVDAVFILPFVFGTLLVGRTSLRQGVAACITVSLAIGAVLLASALLHGFSLLDIFSIAGKFVFPYSIPRIWVQARVLFFGLAALPLLLVGAWLFLSRRPTPMAVLTFLAYPVALTLLAPSITETRYILPLLAPVIAMHGGNGLRWVGGQLLAGTGKSALLARAIALFALLVMAAPPAMVKMADGPRPVVGRLWTPPQWERWQDAVDAGMQRSERLAALLGEGRLNLLVTTHYNDEFYLRLRLIEAGFLPEETAADFPGCRGFSVFQKGAVRVAHIRTYPQYWQTSMSPADNTALQLAAAAECAGLQQYDKAYITTFGNDIEGFPTEVYGFGPSSFAGPLAVEFTDVLAGPTPPQYPILDFRELTREELQQAQQRSAGIVAAAPVHDRKTGRAVTIASYPEFYRRVPGPTTAVLQRIRESLRLNVPAAQPD